MAQVMTESQVPTDALARLRHLYSNLVNGGVRDTASAKRIAEGLLAPVIEDLERRTSAPVGVGEVAERYRNAIASACEGWTMPDGLRKHLETALWSQPTPQPTQPQAGAVPLDEARRLFDAGWNAAALFCDREDVVADGITGFGACPQFEAAFSAAQPVAREPLTPEQIKALMQAHRTAMLMTCKAQVPECGEFAAIAQDLDWLCESFGIKGGQHAE